MNWFIVCSIVNNNMMMFSRFLVLLSFRIHHPFKHFGFCGAEKKREMSWKSHYMFPRGGKTTCCCCCWSEQRAFERVSKQHAYVSPMSKIPRLTLHVNKLQQERLYFTFFHDKKELKSQFYETIKQNLIELWSFLSLSPSDWASAVQYTLTVFILCVLR